MGNKIFKMTEMCPKCYEMIGRPLRYRGYIISKKRLDDYPDEALKTFIKPDTIYTGYIESETGGGDGGCFFIRLLYPDQTQVPITVPDTILEELP